MKLLGLIIIFLGTLLILGGVYDAYDTYSAYAELLDRYGSVEQLHIVGYTHTPSYETPLIAIVTGLVMVAAGNVVRKSGTK